VGGRCHFQRTGERTSFRGIHNGRLHNDTDDRKGLEAKQ
jgi:hypothetical protein